ncbi:hypothetical protein B0T22DRAFT_504628 [Podospora appendiculata]|uniref:Cerato-platanin n=1 Tax=Podospora appendiculata TaxID=314037 RepID=A0AAE0XGT3_9PEZI|nr:hypothetical protein B0T22DRAFT_504628 [Podospora appendiculata]
MLSNILLLAASALGVSAATTPVTPRAADAVGMTPHDQYSSSVGVLGCHINTNRVAYWPMAVDCNNICVQVSYGGRTLNLLRIDQSGGAYDISYDAWNYLYTGQSATVAPVAGGAVSMNYQNVPASNCAGLISSANGGLPLSAANSMNFLTSCAAGTWVGDHHVLYNILNPVCTYGYDEVCTLAAGANQATCPHTLGSNNPLITSPVYNILYPSGQVALAT